MKKNDEKTREPFIVKKIECGRVMEEKTRVFKQLSNVHAFVLFVIVFSIEIIAGAIQNFPTIFFISYFCLAINVTAFFKETPVINSIVAPFSFLSVANAIVDIIFGAQALVVHLPAAIIAVYIVNTRRDFLLPVMMAACFLYTLWLYTIFLHIFSEFGDPAYNNIPPPFDNAVFLAFMCAIGLFSTSFGVWFLRSRCKSSIFPWTLK